MALINGTSGNDDGSIHSALFDLSTDANSTLNANWSTGEDVMIGGSGNDIYNVNSAGDQVFEAIGQGIDLVVSRIAGYTLGANIENLRLDVGALNGTGNDLGNTIYGNAADNSIDGGAGNDDLSGWGGHDILVGGSGSDTLDGGDGPDTMSGGSGDDTYTVSEAADLVIESSVAGGVDTVLSWVSETLDANVENLTLLDVAIASSGTGNAGANKIIGNTSGNALSGLDGNDTLYGLAGNDTLLGGAGNDRLVGGTGDDRMLGGAGNDIYTVDSAGDTVVESARGGGVDSVLASISERLDANVENLTLMNTSAARNGTGNASANTIRGNNGANVLDGAGGADTLFGGLGDDRFVFGMRGAANADAIADFSEVAGRNDDVIALSNALDMGLAGAISPGILGLGFTGGVNPRAADPGDVLSAASFFKGAGFDGHLAGAASGIYVDSLTGSIYYNPTTAAGGDAEWLGSVNLSAVAALDHTDFIYAL